MKQNQPFDFTEKLRPRRDGPNWLRRFVRVFRPMRLLPNAGFTDQVTGERVRYYTDEDGRAWMATNPRKWLNFRVRVPHHDLPNTKLRDGGAETENTN